MLSPIRNILCDKGNRRVVDMTIRYTDNKGKHHIVEVTALEIEGMWHCEASVGKWKLKEKCEVTE